MAQLAEMSQVCLEQPFELYELSEKVSHYLSAYSYRRHGTNNPWNVFWKKLAGVWVKFYKSFPSQIFPTYSTDFTNYLTSEHFILIHVFFSFSFYHLASYFLTSCYSLGWLLASVRLWTPVKFRHIVSYRTRRQRKEREKENRYWKKPVCQWWLAHAHTTHHSTAVSLSTWRRLRQTSSAETTAASAVKIEPPHPCAACNHRHLPSVKPHGLVQPATIVTYPLLNHTALCSLQPSSLTLG